MCYNCVMRNAITWEKKLNCFPSKKRNKVQCRAIQGKPGKNASFCLNNT